MCGIAGMVGPAADRLSFWQRGWVQRPAALAAMEAYFRGEGNNSFFLGQWINLELWAECFLDRSHATAAARAWASRLPGSTNTAFELTAPRGGMA